MEDIKQIEKEAGKDTFFAYVEGWNLNNPRRELFDLEETGEEEGSCISENCMHSSHSERGPVNRLTLKEGVLELLGTVEEPPMDSRDPMNVVEYYAIIQRKEEVGYANTLRVVDEFHYGRTASILNRVAQMEQYNRARTDITAAEKAQREEEEEKRNRPVLTQEQRDEMRKRKEDAVEDIRAREPRKPRAPRI